MLYFVVYDTDDDAIRGELRETLKNLGGDHVQYSAFLITLNDEELLRLIRTIQGIIFNSDTDVRIIPICKKDIARMEIFTTDTPEEEPSVL